MDDVTPVLSGLVDNIQYVAATTIVVAWVYVSVRYVALG